MAHKVSVHIHEPFDAEGAHVVAAFPSVGLVATIAANFLVDQLGLEQVGVMDSPRFPTLSVVEDGEPLNPVRIYAGSYEARRGPRPLVVFLSEFQPNPELVRPVSEAILDWAKEQGTEAIVTPEGLLVEGEAADDDVVEIYTAGSTQATRTLLKEAGAPLFREGIVAGVTGVLLNLGKRDRFNVIAVLSEAQPDHPDARSAATLLDLLGQITGARLDTRRLYDEADAFDKQVDDVTRRRNMQAGEAGQTQSVMYG